MTCLGHAPGTWITQVHVNAWDRVTLQVQLSNSLHVGMRWGVCLEVSVFACSKPALDQLFFSGQVQREPQEVESEEAAPRVVATEEPKTVEEAQAQAPEEELQQVPAEQEACTSRSKW